MTDKDCEHTEVTVKPTGETWCDQCGKLVYEVTAIHELTVISGEGIEYSTTDPEQEAGE
jgi:hypothetical protein